MLEHNLIKGEVGNKVEIFRDSYAVPHIYAQSLDDLLFGLGLAMGQDRLWQMDLSRRMGLGRLSEIFGLETLESDLLARTVGLNRIAKRQTENLDEESRSRLQAFSNGVNRSIEMFEEKLPIEFQLLDYKPEPWMPLDTLAIMRNLWWKLTGRLYVLTTPETVKKYLKDEKLYHAFLSPEDSGETIIPQGSYPKGRLSEKLDSIGQSLSLPDEAFGSNNWVVSSKKSKSGFPLLASDPHQPFVIPQTWYMAHLCGAGINVCGVAHPGLPWILIGRNERVAWGITNNICSLRDLYVEKVNPDNPDEYWNISVNPPRWDKIKSLIEEIKVREKESLTKEIRFTHHGPIVNELTPEVVRFNEPTSLSWVGMEDTDELSVMFETNKAQSLKEFREALRNWSLPTFNMVIADRDGHIAYQCIGKIPKRGRLERGYRKGWESEDQWLGYIPYDEMPHLIDPERGWVATANNKVASDDYPHPLFGTWSSDDRSRRIRGMLEEKEKHSVEDFQGMQLDVVSLRAVDLLPYLLNHLDHLNVGNVGNSFAGNYYKEARAYLRDWDGSLEGDSVAASIFETFFIKWTERVSKERFPKELASALLSPGLANKLLRGDDWGWFKRAGKEEAIRETFVEAIGFLAQKLGDRVSEWKWGRLHTITFRHPLSKKGALGKGFNVGPYSYRGDGTTVQNAGYDSNFNTTGGAEYRQVVDLADPSKLYVSGCMGQSGIPQTQHYDDQTKLWLEGRYFVIELLRFEVEAKAKSKLEVRPTFD